MQENVNTHFVEYLGIQAATVVRPGPGVRVKANEPVVIVTVRPEPNSFRSHNFGLSMIQAQRLWEDLGTILQRSAVLVMLAVLALAATGCSAKVEVERANWNKTSSESTGEKNRTAVQVELLHDKPHKAVPQPSEAKSGAVGQGQVNISGGTVIVIVPGDGPSAQMKAADKPSRETEKQSGCSGLKTRIGWPSDYWRHGIVGFGGYVFVCSLVGWAGWIVIACAFSTEKLDEPMLPMILTLGLLVAAAVIMQALPEPQTGFPFVPLWPWLYSGFVPVGLSILCWMGIVIAAVVAFTGRTDAPAVFSTAMLFSTVVNLLLSSFS